MYSILSMHFISANVAKKTKAYPAPTTIPAAKQTKQLIYRPCDKLSPKGPIWGAPPLPFYLFLKDNFTFL